MSSVEWARNALKVFDEVVAGSGLRARAGQRLMAEQVACSFSEAELGKPPEDEEGRPIETVWDVVTGATAYAKSIPWTAERVEFETTAGDLLDLVEVI